MGESDAAGGSALRRTRARAAGGEELPFDAAQLDWVYPHAASAVIPSKVTATQLKGRALDQEIAENAAPERRVRAVSFEKPRFLQKERGLTAAERGTAMHAVMQYLDFARPADEQSVREQVMQLRERRQLTPGARRQPSTCMRSHSSCALRWRSASDRRKRFTGNTDLRFSSRRRSMTPRSMSGSPDDAAGRRGLLL